MAHTVVTTLPTEKPSLSCLNDGTPPDTPPSTPRGKWAVPARDSAGWVDINRETGRTSKTSCRPSIIRDLLAVPSVEETKRLAVPYVLVSRVIIENKYFIGFTTLLTVYALLGDDIRTLAFDAPADIAFNCIVIFCITVFSLEIVLSVFGKDDYFLGFFFILDVVSTGTLILDLSWVSDSIASSQKNDSAANNARTSRAARLGAKMGRIVRVIRLVRILKLYKAVGEARAAKRREQARVANPGEEEDWNEDDMQNGDDPAEVESRVGKKLSEWTTRRVIVLVLTMLLVMPLLIADETEKSPFSALYGANTVYNKFIADTDTYAKLQYETAMLRFLYYHNWFARRGYCPSETCANAYLSHVFWIGVQGHDTQAVETMAASASIRPSTVQSWEMQTASQNFMYNWGYMPEWAQDALGSNWTKACDTDSVSRRGISLLTKIDGYQVHCPEDLRPTEYVRYWPQDMYESDSDVSHLVFFFDKRPFTKKDAAYNIGVTCFICVVLCTASLLFANDANRLILKPVEKMIARVEAIRDNPLVALKMADEEFKMEEIQKAMNRRQTTGPERARKLVQEALSCHQLRTAKEPSELVILEKTIIKLGSLLALSFGEAGTNIIRHNMRGSDSAGVNAMVPGTRVDCITGIARIRDFSIATEVLQAKIMTFVNQISEIVHGVVDEFHGAPNKNNGDMFLLIWRVDESTVMSRHAEMAIVALAQVLGAVHRSHLLYTYRKHPGLIQRMGRNCRVHLSFGLHCGWAIEGAVGSEFKIDASYISPNVSIANSIEHATRIYDVPLLVAQSVAELCTPTMFGKCRLIDKVLITGSPRPMELFSVDLDFMSLDADEVRLPTRNWNTRQRFKARQYLEGQKFHKLNPSLDMAKVFDGDPNIAKMRERYTEKFVRQFNMGYQNYSQGEWEVARRMLRRAGAALGVADGPSEAILKFMEVPHGFVAPDGWAGTRDLV